MTQIVTPKVIKGWMSHQTNLGIESYDLNEDYSPDTGVWQSKVLDLASSKYNPQTATSPTQYWFDKSRYRNHGTISGATWVRNSKGLWCLNFDGDDFVTITDSPSLDLSGSFALETWFKPTTIDKFHTLFSKGADRAYNFRIRDTNVVQLYVVLSDGVTVKIAATTDIVSLNTWHHLVGTGTAGSNLLIYLNGVLSKTGEVFADIETNTTNLFLGKRSDGWVSGFAAGVMALNRIYKDVSLTAAQAANHFNQEKHLFGR